VLSELKALSDLVEKVSPETLLVVDGVCSVGSEEIRFDDWKLDVVLTASQKALLVSAS
jgi:alanine-glyoxylate transaminase/serine-glyoxylate transaminase/serine-pyruvate transaminase